ncbi:MAG: hypothetical protein ACOC7K_01615, partial [bacterium]
SLWTIKHKTLTLAARVGGQPDMELEAASFRSTKNTCRLESDVREKVSVHGQEATEPLMNADIQMFRSHRASDSHLSKDLLDELFYTS